MNVDVNIPIHELVPKPTVIAYAVGSAAKYHYKLLLIVALCYMLGVHCSRFLASRMIMLLKTVQSRNVRWSAIQQFSSRFENLIASTNVVFAGF